jgi:hypothetical protein
MKRIFQIFGGGLGWSLGGPIGAILGVAFGNIVHDFVGSSEATTTNTKILIPISSITVPPTTKSKFVSKATESFQKILTAIVQ